MPLSGILTDYWGWEACFYIYGKHKQCGQIFVSKTDDLTCFFAFYNVSVSTYTWYFPFTCVTAVAQGKYESFNNTFRF